MLPDEGALPRPGRDRAQLSALFALVKSGEVQRRLWAMTAWKQMPNATFVE
jgi:hypothetical protein